MSLATADPAPVPPLASVVENGEIEDSKILPGEGRGRGIQDHGPKSFVTDKGDSSSSSPSSLLLLLSSLLLLPLRRPDSLPSWGISGG